MKKFTLGLVLLCGTAPLIGLAQIPSIPGFGSKSSGGPDMMASQISLVTSYVAASKDVLTSQAMMLQALGLKDQADTAQAAADSLGAGATKGNLEAAQSVQSESSKALSGAMKASVPEVSAESKKTYALGLGFLAGGIVKYVAMKNSIAGFKGGMSGASLLQGPKLMSGVYIVTTFPGNMLSLAETMQNAVAFAHAHGIEVPSEATSVI